MKKRRYQYLLCILFCFLLFNGCSRFDPSKKQQLESEELSPISKSSFKLNTVVSITIYDSTDTSLLDGALALCDKYEAMLSKTKEESEICKLNKGISVSLSKETLSLIETGLYYSKHSNGAFDISIEPLSSLWDFTALSPSVPSKTSIEEALRHIGWNYVHISNQSVSFEQSDMGIDLGAIAKGFIADRIKEYLLENNVQSALINLGGNVLLVGSKPNGDDFKVGIQKPFEDRNETIAIMELSDVSIVSSGIYERYFKQDDILYHHILNPSTGYPYDTGLTAVTVITNHSVDGDALSTTAFALGLEQGMEFINSLEDVYAVFITKENELYYSDGFKETIPISN